MAKDFSSHGGNLNVKFEQHEVRKTKEEKMVRRDNEMQYFCGKVCESQKECEMMPLFLLYMVI